MALLMRLFGSGFVAALLILSILAKGVHTALMPLASERFFGSALPGLIVAFAIAVLPIYPLRPAWDATVSADILIVCVLVLGSTLGKNPVATGLLAGFLLLLNPVAGLILIVFIASSAAAGKPGLKGSAWAALVCLAVLSPWTVRNYRQFGQFIPLRDDLGIALFSSNNACAQPTLDENNASGCHAKTHPIESIAENRLVAEMGEAAYNRMRLGSAMQWIRRNPGLFWSLTFRRFLYFWFPPTIPSVAAISALGFAGLILLIRRKWPHASLFVCALFSGSFLYYFVEGNERYRIPVYWCLFLCAGYLVSETCRFALRRR